MSDMKPYVGVIVPAGGSGRRFGGPVPKQLLRIGNTPILLHTLRVFQSHPGIMEIVLVMRNAELEMAKSMARHHSLSKVRAIVGGGRDRQESVWNGLQALSPSVQLVLVHDAVRPFVDKTVISNVIRAAEQHGAAIAAARVRDTILQESADGILSTPIPRETLWAAQTPQGFRRELFADAHSSAKTDGYHGTDDASLVLRQGKPVQVVESPDWNLKITTPSDLVIGRSILARRKKASK